MTFKQWLEEQYIHSPHAMIARLLLSDVLFPFDLTKDEMFLYLCESREPKNVLRLFLKAYKDWQDEYWIKSE